MYQSIILHHFYDFHPLSCRRTIGVMVIKSNQIKSNQIKSNQSCFQNYIQNVQMLMTNFEFKNVVSREFRLKFLCRKSPNELIVVNPPMN